MTVQGAKSPLTLTAEVLPVIPGVHMVEMTRASGDINDFYQLYALLSKAVIPALAKAAASPPRQAPAGSATTSPQQGSESQQRPTPGKGAGTGNGKRVQWDDSTDGGDSQRAASGGEPSLSANADAPVLHSAGGQGSDDESESRELGEEGSEEIGGLQSLGGDNSVTSRLAGTRSAGPMHDGLTSLESLGGQLQASSLGH